MLSQKKNVNLCIKQCMDNFEQYYPPKPSIERKEGKGHISVTIFSMVLFALTFSLIINDYLLISFLLLVLLIHELGHFVFMKWFGYKGLKMLFIPFMGAMVKGEKNLYSEKESAIMVLAGPLPGILIGYLLLQKGIQVEVYWMIQLGIIFLLLNVMNLVPIDPLDGGQLLRILFLGKQELVQLIFSFVSSLSMIIIGVWMDSWLIIIFGFLLGYRVKNMYKLFRIRKDMQAEEITFESSYEKLSDKAFAKIKQIVLEYTPILNKIKEESDEDHFDQIMAHQVEGVLLVPTKKDASLGFKTFIFLLWLGAIGLSVYTIWTIDFNEVINAFQNR